MASGLLIIALGEATKMIPYMEGRDDGRGMRDDVNQAIRPPSSIIHHPSSIKKYLFQIRWGVRTDTDDITGTVTEQGGRVPAIEEIRTALPLLVGEYDQMPPAFSAKKLDGVPAYKLARAGKTPELRPKKINIYSLNANAPTSPPYHISLITYHLTCSKGTYVRSVVRDLAAKLGTIATTAMIRRVETNGIGIEDAAELDFLEKMYNNDPRSVLEYLKPLDFGLGDIPVQNLDDSDTRLFQNGVAIVTKHGSTGLRRVYSGKRFLGIGMNDNYALMPKRVIKS